MTDQPSSKPPTPVRSKPSWWSRIIWIRWQESEALTLKGLALPASEKRAAAHLVRAIRFVTEALISMSSPVAHVVCTIVDGKGVLEFETTDKRGRTRSRFDVGFRVEPWMSVLSDPLAVALDFKFLRDTRPRPRTRRTRIVPLVRLRDLVWIGGSR